MADRIKKGKEKQNPSVTLGYSFDHSALKYIVLILIVWNIFFIQIQTFLIDVHSLLILNIDYFTLLENRLLRIYPAILLTTRSHVI